MKISTEETLQNKYAAESKLRTKSQAQKRKKWFSRYRTWVIRRRATRNNQKLPKQPRESGKSQDYIYHSPRRGRVEGLYQTPEWNQEEKMGSPHIYGKIPKRSPEGDMERGKPLQTHRNPNKTDQSDWYHWKDSCKFRPGSQQSQKSGRGDSCQNMTANLHISKVHINTWHMLVNNQPTAWVPDTEAD